MGLYICSAVLAESEKGRDGPEATLLVEDGKHEGGSPRSLCLMAPESDRNAGCLAPSLAVWSEPCGPNGLPDTKICNCFHTSASSKSPELPTKS